MFHAGPASRKMRRSQQLSRSATGPHASPRVAMLQVTLRARRLLSAGKCKSADDNSTPLEVDHAANDDSSEPVSESCCDDDPTTSGAGVHYLQHGDANSKLARRSPAGRGPRQFRWFGGLWTAGIFIGEDCWGRGGTNWPVALALGDFPPRTKKDRVLVWWLADWI